MVTKDGQEIRMTIFSGEVYLHRDDLLDLIKEASKRADTLNAKSIFNSLLESLSVESLVEYVRKSLS